MTKFISTISENAKFPLSYIKGTEKQRYKLSSKLAQKVFEDIKSCDTLTTDKLKNAIEKCTAPYKINLTIAKKFNNDSFDSIIQKVPSVAIYEDYADYLKKNNGKENKCLEFNEPFMNVTIDSFKMKLHLNGDEIISNKYIILHELQHFFDYLCNPKTSVIRGISTVTDEEKYNVFIDIFQMFVEFNKYPNFNKIKPEITKKMKLLSNNLQIGLLQDLRGNIKSEINAYRQELKGYCKNPIKEFDNIIGLSILLLTKANLHKKMKFLNKMLKNCIKQE